MTQISSNSKKNDKGYLHVQLFTELTVLYILPERSRTADTVAN